MNRNSMQLFQCLLRGYATLEQTVLFREYFSAKYLNKLIVNVQFQRTIIVQCTIIKLYKIIFDVKKSLARLFSKKISSISDTVSNWYMISY